jgi:hypothetical protein
MGCSGSGEIRATDGKIKAPTFVWGMWLVGLRVLGIGPGVPAGAVIVKLNEFNTSSAVGRRFASVERHDRPGRRGKRSSGSHPARKPGCQTSKELRRPGHAGREESRTYWQGVRARQRDYRPFDVWAGPACRALTCCAFARSAGRRHGSDRSPSGQAVSLGATFETRRVSQT